MSALLLTQGAIHQPIKPLKPLKPQGIGATMNYGRHGDQPCMGLELRSYGGSEHGQTSIRVVLLVFTHSILFETSTLWLPPSVWALKLEDMATDLQMLARILEASLDPTQNKQGQDIKSLHRTSY